MNWRPKIGEGKKPEKFCMLWVEGKVHFVFICDLEEANAEAERLASSYPGRRVHLLEAAQYCVAQLESDVMWERYEGGANETVSQD